MPARCPSCGGSRTCHRPDSYVMPRDRENQPQNKNLKPFLASDTALGDKYGRISAGTYRYLYNVYLCRPIIKENA